MTEQINILCYSSCRGIAEELVDKLKQSGRRPQIIALDNCDMSGLIQYENCLNVLIFEKGDLIALNNTEWGRFQKLGAVRGNNGFSVAFCIDCEDWPLAMEEYFQVKKTGNSAEEIRRQIVHIHNRLYQSSRGRYGYFVGRNNEIEQFQNLLYSERASKINALIVSGRQGVGREAYVRECIRQGKGEENYEPYILSMGKNGNIEMFLIQLNSIHHLYSEEEFVEILKSGLEEKVKMAVKILNELFVNDDYLLLYDDGAACIRYNRVLSDWFKSVVTHPSLKGGIHLYVISNISVSYSRIMADNELAFITLYALTVSDRKKLLYKRLSELSISLAEEQVAFLADTLMYSPSQLMKVIEDIKSKGFKIVKDGISAYQIVGDKNIMSLINNYATEGHPDAKNILVLLSRIEYVHNKILYSIFADTQYEAEAEIERFMADGIVERFGEWMELIRLDSSISDFIRRNKIDYTEKSLKGLVIEKLDEVISDSPRITEDYAAYLYKLKKGIRLGNIDNESYLVPSVLVNSIAEFYDNREWPQTIRLCEDVIASHKDYFDDVYREVKYWYCLALARTQNEDKFYPIVTEFTGADLHFLKGFYLRIAKQFARAEEEYGKALKINPSFSRVKREMVIVLQAQHKFRDALELAKLNYEKDPENAYHIHAYFRCLVRKNEITQEERVLLKQFKDDSNNLFKSRYFTEGMNFEYKRFVDRAKPEVLLPLASELQKRYKGVAYIQDITDDYYMAQGLKSHLKPVDFSYEFGL